MARCLKPVSSKPLGSNLFAQDFSDESQDLLLGAVFGILMAFMLFFQEGQLIDYVDNYAKEVAAQEAVPADSLYDEPTMVAAVR